MAAGSQFRLIFLSSTKRNGSPTTISNYNIFVQGRAAAGHTDIRTHSAGFKAVVCTAADDARDNTSTTGTGVPIYWLNGTKVADNYGDFYDGSWDDEANDKNESGTNGPDTSVRTNYPFTGCNHDGTEEFALGASQVGVGRPNSSSSGHGPLSSSVLVDKTLSRPLYGLSALFQVADATNTPAAGAPAITAPNAFRVPAVLSVDLSSITDTDGTTGIATTATYKWQRFNAAGTILDTDSIGTSSTYTLTDADANKRLKVVVSFIDDAGNSEGPLTSAAAGILAAATDCNAPTLTGGATFLGSARKMAVGKISFLGHLTIGFLKTSGSGTLDNAAFTTAGSNNYEIVGIANTNNFVVRLNTDLTAADKSTLVLHICDQAYAFGSSSSSNADYQFNTPSQNWSPHAERTIYLSQDTVAPTFTWATVNGTSLVITLSEDLGAAASLDNTDFAVKKNGSTTPLSTTAPVILGNTVTLTLTTAVAATDTNVLVTYTKPTSGTANKLMDRFGNQVETFTDEDAVQHQALVSNIGQANDGGYQSTLLDLAQEFTTGANDTGYTLTSIDMFLWSLNGSATSPTVTLHSGSASGTKVADFTGPSTIGPGDVSYTFIPATTVTLNASTEYWVVAKGATSHWNNTNADDEDSGGALGWTIADVGQRGEPGTGNFEDYSTSAFQFGVNGTVNPPPVTLVSNLSQTADENATYSRDHGQAFTTGSNGSGYTVTSVTIVSTDPNNDAIPLQICEVDGSVHPTTVCTNLTPPSSYPQGNLTYTVPTTTPLTLNADTTYMLVFKAPPSPTELRVAATSSDDQDSTSLTGFSIANVFQWYNNSNTWVIGNFSRAIRITITGVVNPNDPHHHHRRRQSSTGVMTPPPVRRPSAAS